MLNREERGVEVAFQDTSGTCGMQMMLGGRIHKAVLSKGLHPRRVPRATALYGSPFQRPAGAAELRGWGGALPGLRGWVGVALAPPQLTEPQASPTREEATSRKLQWSSLVPGGRLGEARPCWGRPGLAGAEPQP